MIKKLKVKGIKLVIKDVFFLFSIFYFLFSLIGCDAFVRKFTRKPKRENLPKEELVLEPQEYKGSELTKEELYRQYFLFWKSWQEELIISLSEGNNYKKRVDCVNEAVKNLNELKVLLDEDKGKKIEVYINQITVLGDGIEKDIYGMNVMKDRLSAERLQRLILKQFTYYKVKGCLK